MWGTGYPYLAGLLFYPPLLHSWHDDDFMPCCCLCGTDGVLTRGIEFDVSALRCVDWCKEGVRLRAEECSGAVGFGGMDGAAVGPGDAPSPATARSERVLAVLLQQPMGTKWPVQ